jgi:hypothetical protein
MAGLATIASIAGTVVSAVGTIAAGRAQKQQADYQAAHDEVKAKQEQAEGQRDALDKAREKRFALSRLQSRAAASGFMASDPTTLDLTGEIAKYGTYQQQLAAYGGATRSRDFQVSAESARMRGRAAMQGARFDALGTILGGVSSMFSKFGRYG